jgi:predicted GNAT family N-acyltransferase
MLHALCSAQGFYMRSGFSPRGAVFSEGGLDHIEMVLAL